MPRFNTISISGYTLGEAVAAAMQQVAFTLADGIEYIKAAISAGLKIDDFALACRSSSASAWMFMNVAMLMRHVIEQRSFVGAVEITGCVRRCQTSGWN